MQTKDDKCDQHLVVNRPFTLSVKLFDAENEKQLTFLVYFLILRTKIHVIKKQGVICMSLTPYDPFRQLANMRRNFDRFFSDFPLDLGMENNNFGNIRVDVHETENEVIASCDIPGLEKKEDVNIDIENNMLSINGTINKTNEIKEESMYRKERYTGSFHRTVSLPSPVSNEGVKATYKNGVLEVRMPKKTNDNKKKIDVDFH